MKKPAVPLPAALVTPILHKLAPELGRTDNERLATLTALLGADNQASLAKVLQALYPNASIDDARNNFRVLRSALKAKVKEHANLAFELKVDTAIKRPPNERTCWFEGSDVKRDHIANLNDIQSAKAQSISLLGVEQQNGKPVVRYFLSYSHADYAKRVKALLELVTVRLKNSSQYTFIPWRDNDHILPGDKWHDEVQNAIAHCAFGLLLVSQSFLNRKYIKEHELPHFVAANEDDTDPKKIAIPVALEDIFTDNTDLLGLQHQQIFKNEEGRAWSLLSTSMQKEKFANLLVDRIHKVLKKRFSPESGMPKLDATHLTQSAMSLAKKRRVEAAEEMNNALCAEPNTSFVPTYAATGNLAVAATQAAQINGAPVHVLESMDAWLAEKNGPDYCAVLGETGTGKTTTVKEFSKRLAAKLKAGETTEQPLYMDLRLLGTAVKSPLTLEIIITKLWQNIWRSGAADNAVVAEDVIRMVQHEGAVAIFDGLDEVLVHLDKESSGQAFVRELLRILPPPLPNSTGDKSTEKRGRVVLTCRTHYFRTLRQQRRFLSLGDREGLKKPVNRASSGIKNSENDADESQETDNFRTFTLLPFTRDQIKQYFALTLPDRDSEQIMQLIESVHNLSEIASRPYTLSLLAQEIAQIEQWKLQGRTVSNVTLYSHFAASWLERDIGKHTFTLEHKLQLMEHLAASLWLKKQRSFAVDDLDQWLIDFLYDNPRFAFHYNADAKESLKSDFRTATFLVNEGNDQFRFAHKRALGYAGSEH
jgi:TIR domain